MDMWAAELLLQMKNEKEFEQLELITVISFKGYDSKWKDGNTKSRMQAILKDCDEIEYMDNLPLTAGEYYIKRNYYMVDHSKYLLAVYDNSKKMARSGTMQTVNYAIKKGLTVIFINPETAEATVQEGGRYGKGIKKYRL